MSITPSTTVRDAFFKPMDDLAAQSPHTRPCPEFLDAVFVGMGLQRVLEASPSGRAFLQEHGGRFEKAPDFNNYFAALKSSRRRDLIKDCGLRLREQLDRRLEDRLEDIPELERYAPFALDGHWHQGAVHDARHKEAKMAVGHFYSLSLRTHTLRHLAAGEGLHEHDMRALKRVKPKGLRQGVPPGTRVILVYDKAGIDFGYWKRCRQECAVYFISRPKSNLVYCLIDRREWDRKDPRQSGVTDDLLIATRENQLLRLVCYTDPRTQEAYEFLTNEMDLSPGVIAELYRRRWEVEKVFDEIKNKLGQQKAWGSSLVAKETQAQFIAITHNLLLSYEQTLEKDHGVTNQAEDQRRAQRMEAAVQTCRKNHQPLSSLVVQAQRATQRSVKFIRWVRQSIRDQLAEAAAVLRLKALYSTL